MLAFVGVGIVAWSFLGAVRLAMCARALHNLLHHRRLGQSTLTRSKYAARNRLRIKRVRAFAVGEWPRDPDHVLAICDALGNCGATDGARTRPTFVRGRTGIYLSMLCSTGPK
jgi:hypothetical protein